jgi:uncharacterized small protein (DUF1192 family)
MKYNLFIVLGLLVAGFFVEASPSVSSSEKPAEMKWDETTLSLRVFNLETKISDLQNELNHYSVIQEPISNEKMNALKTEIKKLKAQKKDLEKQKVVLRK